MSPKHFPEGDTPMPNDDARRSTAKLLGVGSSSMGMNGGFVLDNAAGTSITYADPGSNNATLSLSRTGRAFTVNLATGAGGAVTTTATQVKALFDADPVASKLFSVANKAANDGTGVVGAMSAVNFSSGTATTSLADSNDDLDFTAKQTVTGPFRSIVAIDDAVVASAVLTEAWGGYTALTAASLSAGAAVVMGFASVTRTSGTIACYY